ncbi:glycosyltransferase [Rothia nasimurium]|uniref:Glycosyltransferase n=1 Tax=Rothia nasimurium TaxID=85336 RepID=A0A4Y9F8H2_9MICC|nr:glycosyltransferase [Rothia nasimurium]MBF0807037.1 glycosyltransferase [Rothia nasimurium]TFU24360.1 glycosyltransferase [Rothia nasimurium]
MAVNSSLPVALHCVPVPEFGGVARHISDLAEAGLPGYHLIILCPAGALSTRLKELGADVREADFGTDAGFAASLRTLDILIDDLKPAIVHSHLAYADVVVAAVVNLRKARKLVRRGTYVPTLFTTEHGIAGDDAVYHGASWRSRLMETVHRVRLWGTDGKIAVSRSTADQMRRKWGARGVDTVYNGIDVVETFDAVAAHRVEAGEGALRVLSLSRLAPEKGLDILVEAFARVHEQVPGAALEIAGAGELKDALTRQVAELGLEKAVTFPGFVDPIEAMGRADVLVQLSVWENCSYTLLDAKAAGLNVVATAVGGNPEILDGSELVPSMNQMNRKAAVAAVAQKILEAKESSNEPLNWVSTTDMGQQIADLYRKAD